MQKFIDILNKSPLFRSLGFSYEHALESNCTADSAIVIMKDIIVRSRDVYNSRRNNNNIDFLTLHAEHALLYYRIKFVDVLSVVFQVSWELKLCGETSLYDDLIQDKHVPGSLGRAFSNFCIYAQKDFRRLRNGHALVYAFEEIFMSDAINCCDKDLIKILLNTDSYFKNTDNLLYLDMQDIFKLTEIYDPINQTYTSYLHSCNNPFALLKDPVFLEPRTRENSNFLWFIRFEQNFNSNKINVIENAESTTNNIIQFTKLDKSKIKEISSDSADSSKSADIIDINLYSWLSSGLK